MKRLRPRSPSSKQPHPINENVISSVRRLFEIIDASGYSYISIGNAAGVSISSFQQWRSGKACPSLPAVESLLEVLGHRMVFVHSQPHRITVYPTDDGFVVAFGDIWWPGHYDTADTARYSTEFTEEHILNIIAGKSGAAITMEDLKP